MTRPLPLALVQAPVVPGSSLDSFGVSLERLARTHPHVRLVVHPELHLCGTGGGEHDELPARIEELAEPLDGPRDKELAQMAGDLGLWLIPGSVYERGSDGRIYNTATAYSPAGKRVAAYRKVFPWRPYEKVAAGSEFVVFELDGVGRIGLSICYDAWFPESSRHLAWMGAELIVNLVQTPTSDRAQEIVLARANAITNQVFVASVNAATPDGLGRSLLVDPQGRVLVEADGAEPTVLTDTIDLDAVTNARTYGTGGVTTPWSQFGDGDSPLNLPLYAGRIDPSAWRPSEENN